MTSETYRVVVQKYGGSSVADPEKLKAVARRIIETKEKGFRVVVVVSAMGDTTNKLLDLAKEVVTTPTARELDMLLSVGERISMTLLSMALNEAGHPAKSFTGSQSGIITDTTHSNARIIEVRPQRILEALDAGLIAIVAGFQGVSLEREVTTLGRGGSDTSAVALAAALEAEFLEICSDVDGVLSADPRIVDDARKIERLTFEEMQEMAEAGAKVLNSAAVAYAKQAGITIHSVSTFGGGTGTAVADFENDHRTGRVRGVVYERNIIFVASKRRFSMDEITAALDYLDGRHVAYKQFDLGIQTDDGYEFTFILPLENLHGYENIRDELSRRYPDGITFFEGRGTVSLIGEGIINDGTNLKRAVTVLTNAGIDIHDIHTSRFRISVVVERDRLDEAVRLLHAAFPDQE
ncbi:MAG: aspartate kinase [Deltaproteobacteria bacterium]|nr:aspartate kinase [Candidatus Zymogenaceae bacterium]